LHYKFQIHLYSKMIITRLIKFSWKNILFTSHFFEGVEWYVQTSIILTPNSDLSEIHILNSYSSHFSWIIKGSDTESIYTKDIHKISDNHKKKKKIHTASSIQREHYKHNQFVTNNCENSASKVISMMPTVQILFRIFNVLSRTALGHNQPPIQWVPGVLP